jgi:hypothetical protein
LDDCFADRFFRRDWNRFLALAQNKRHNRPKEKQPD